MNTKQRHDSGFTLIELMMVLSILGVVAGIAGIRATTMVARLEYNHYVSRCHGFFARARAQAIMNNAVQRVVVKVGTNRLVRYGQQLSLNPPRHDEVEAEVLDVPLKVCSLAIVADPNGSAAADEPGSYTFLPDGLGDEFKPLRLDVVQSSLLGKRLYYRITRDTRGKVTLTGPKRVER